MYEYRAHILSVYDGDTVRADIDLGLSIWLRNEKLRLAEINAPELKSDGGIEARDRLRELILDQDVKIVTVKDRKGKYGRYLAWIYLDDRIRSVNDMLVQEGHAVRKKY